MTNPENLSSFADPSCVEKIGILREIVNSCDALAFLIGAGCSFCAGLPLTDKLTNGVLESDQVDVTSKNILQAVSKRFTDSTEANIEDFLSEIIDLFTIADRRSDKGAPNSAVDLGDEEYTANQLRDASVQIKRAIACLIGREVVIECHREFVAAVHRPLRVGRQNSSHPVDYLVLNYDTIIEDALALEGISYADGMKGGLSAWWEPQTFKEPGLSARVIKLHGSIDWQQHPNSRLPRRVNPNIRLQNQENVPLLIWPSAMKYQETQLDPFAQLMDQARQSIKTSRNLQRLLVICGYSFGDKHINFEIENALRESNGNLTVVAFTQTDKPKGKLKEWYDDNDLTGNVLIYANMGFYHDNDATLFTKETPWWKFENLTKILKGEF